MVQALCPPNGAGPYSRSGSTKAKLAVPSLYPATSVAFGCLHRASAALRAMPANRARQGDKPLLARVFKPRGDEPFPALVECHGGGSSDRRARHFMFIYAPSVQ